MSQFQVFILAADNVLYEGPCESLVVPTSQGQYGILANHSNMISAVIPGKLTYRIPDGEEQFAAVSAGLVKVENNEVLVLVDTAERPEDIDVNRAKRAADEAKEAMLQKRSIQEYRSAQANLAREVNRLEVKRHYDDARGRHM
ncbi:MAG: ATP synthase F1 subunit epsilon [Lachnospiraceae bacterium]|nr:ATP synthase F1 subunit epsilon [Lachnospiraceae bacterium]